MRDAERPIALGGVKQRSVLALLMLRSGEVVSSDRLIHELWGESPPRTAATALQGYVSQLRRALEPGRAAGESRVILTREPGYLLAIDPEQLDLHRFERLRATAREAQADGDFRTAAARLEGALALWRGSALDDLANERFATEPVRRLEEMRLAATEERIDAKLALGGDRELVAEIGTLIAQDPLREHAREQLMLALYRCGRQAEALRAYDDARRTLVTELGIEPASGLRNLQQRILEQDPTLELAPAQREGAGRARPAEGHRRRVAVAGGLLVVAIPALVLLLGLGAGRRIPKIAGSSLVLISPRHGDVQAAVAVGGDPTSVTVGAGAAWVLNADEQSVTRIDLRTRAERTFGTGGIPTDIAAGDGSLWVANGSHVRGQFVGPVATTVSRLDPDSAAVMSTIALPRGRGELSNQTAYHIAVGPEGVWAVNPDLSISRIDPATDRIAARIPDVSALAVTTSPEGTWALESDGTIVRLGRDRVLERVRVPASSLSSIAIGAGAVWATDPDQGTLWRIDPSPAPVERTIPLAVGATDVAYGAGGVWVANGLTGTVTRVDPHSNQPTETIPIGNTPGRLTVGDGRVWVAVAGAPGVSVPVASQGNSDIHALPASVCGPVLSGGAGSPQRLIVSDLPLRGAPGLPTREMSAAIAYVLREHDFRAGRWRVAYQSCDDSTAQSAIFDDRKCVSNAKAWVGNPLVVGVVGPYNSGCAYDELPITNRGGPLAMISPTNSDIGLTHAGPLTPPNVLARLYPTGTRNYARLYSSDDLQAAAMAAFARRQRLKSMYILDDGGNGRISAASFRLAAERLHVRVVGSASWNPAAHDYTGLSQRIERSGADGVDVSGLIDTNGGAVIRAIRQQLGYRITILANDGVLPISGLFQRAGPAARGVYISTAPVPNGQLGLAGREFVSRFTAAEHRAVVDHASVYAAQATEALLAAIAHSNGTRASVTRALLVTCIREGILGSFCFDPSGDPTPSSVTIVRVVRPGGSAVVESIDGSDTVGVFHPSRTLVR